MTRADRFDVLMLEQILRGGKEKPRRVTRLAENVIAVVAEKAAYLTGCVIVVNREQESLAQPNRGLGLSTDCTDTALSEKHAVVVGGRKPEYALDAAVPTGTRRAAIGLAAILTSALTRFARLPFAGGFQSLDIGLRTGSAALKTAALFVYALYSSVVAVAADVRAAWARPLCFEVPLVLSFAFTTAILRVERIWQRGIVSTATELFVTHFYRLSPLDKSIKCAGAIDVAELATSAA